MRKLVFKISARVMVGLVGACLFGLAGEFAIEYARARGAYENPVEKVDSAMSIIFAFLTSKYFVMAAVLSTAFFCGLFLDQFLYKKEVNDEIERLSTELNLERKTIQRHERHLENSSDEIKEFVTLIDMLSPGFNLIHMSVERILQVQLGLPLKAAFFNIDKLTTVTGHFASSAMSFWQIMQVIKNKTETDFTQQEILQISNHINGDLQYYGRLCKAVLFDETETIEALEKSFATERKPTHPYQLTMNKNGDDVSITLTKPVAEPTTEAP